MKYFIIAISFIASSTAVNSPLLCEIYDPQLNITQKKGNICFGQLTDSNGACNFTKECTPGSNPPTEASCYATWTNQSGIIEVKQKGCWHRSEHEPCSNSTVCKANSASKIRFCCCGKSQLCNSQIFDGPPILPVSEEIEEMNKESNQYDLMLLYTLLPISLLFLLVFVCYLCYKRKIKQRFDDIRTLNVEIPGSCVTTAATTMLSTDQSEFKFPELIQLKARGRFGCVWKAQLHDRYVAVKLFYAQDKKSWLNEQDILNNPLMCKHPNVLHFIAATSRRVGVNTEFWLITDFYELGSLAEFLKVRKLSLADALKFSKSMAAGLSFLHEDRLCRDSKTGYKYAIAHRDFKSKNVLIAHDMSAVIADFGLAVKFVPGESTGENHGQVGTKRYMAPEILEGAINFQRDAFLRIDMYAFSLVLWEVITRCFDLPGVTSPTYLMPYEAELGQFPSLEQMQEYVVERKMRPKIQDEWRQHTIIGLLCETMEECWDHDAEARLSAGCVEERIHSFQQHFISPPAGIPIHSNIFDGDLITNSTPVISSTVDVELQNEINNHNIGRTVDLDSAADENEYEQEMICCPESSLL